MSARLSLALWPRPPDGDGESSLVAFVHAWAVDLVLAPRPVPPPAGWTPPGRLRLVASWPGFVALRREDACSEIRRARRRTDGLDLPSLRLRVPPSTGQVDGEAAGEAANEEKDEAPLLALLPRRNAPSPGGLVDLEAHLGAGPFLADARPWLDEGLMPSTLLARVTPAAGSPIRAMLVVVPRRKRHSGAVLAEDAALLLAGRARPARADGERHDLDGLLDGDEDVPPPRRFAELQLSLPPERARKAVDLRNRLKRALGFLVPGGRLRVRGDEVPPSELERAFERCGLLDFRRVEESPAVFEGRRMATWPRPRRPVHWIDEEEAFAALCRELLHAPFVGLDVETSPWAPRGALATIQLATTEATWVADALELERFDDLGRLLASPRVAKIIHFAAFEQAVFRPLAMPIRNVLDTWAASRARHPRRIPGGHGLAAVCRRELDRDMDKACQVADWCLRPLPPDRLDYAAIDAEVLVDLWEVFGSSYETRVDLA